MHVALMTHAATLTADDLHIIADNQILEEKNALRNERPR